MVGRDEEMAKQKKELVERMNFSKRSRMS